MPRRSRTARLVRVVVACAVGSSAALAGACSAAHAARLGEHGAHMVGAWSAPTGSKGVLLVPQAGDGASEWSQEWVVPRQEGYVVGSLDWRPDDADSMRLAAQQLRDVGVQQLAIVGASQGGTFAAAMAEELGSVAVVSLSPPSAFGTGDATAAHTADTGPLTVYASKDDDAVPPSDSRLVARTASDFHVLPGDARGVALLQGQYSTDVQRGIDATLRAGFGG